jgi:hypothetical protein
MRLKRRTPRHLKTIIFHWEKWCLWVSAIPTAHQDRKVMQEQLSELPEVH